jgi:hypothetical protein
MEHAHCHDWSHAHFSAERHVSGQPDSNAIRRCECDAVSYRQRAVRCNGHANGDSNAGAHRGVGNSDSVLDPVGANLDKLRDCGADLHYDGDIEPDSNAHGDRGRSRSHLDPRDHNGDNSASDEYGNPGYANSHFDHRLGHGLEYTVGYAEPGEHRNGNALLHPDSGSRDSCGNSTDPDSRRSRQPDGQPHGFVNDPHK